MGYPLFWSAMLKDNSSFDFLHALAQTTPQIVFAYQVDAHKFTYLNPAFEGIFKQKAENLNPMALLHTVHEEDLQYVREVYEELLKGENKKQIEFRIRLADKTERWLRVMPLLLEEKEKRVIAGLAEDITEFKHYAEVEGKYSHKKNAVIQILAHDLAGPLGMIQSLSSLIATRIKSYKDEGLSHMVNLITETSQGSIHLIRDFVDQEFLESSETALITGRVNMVERFSQIIEQYQHAQQNSAKTFSFSSSQPSIYAEIDDIKFFQAIMNLITNAMKFTKDDGIINIRMEDKADTGSLLISIADNGIGIPEKYHGSLFDKFTRARRSGLRQEPTTGLGLWITKTIIEWHQGKIWFESEENKGTTFYVEIPKDYIK